MLEINEISLCCLIPERLQEALIVVFVVDIFAFYTVENSHWECIVLYRGESDKESKSII
jgi:hypothetical protein